MNEDDISLRHLRVLSLLLEVGNLTRAAQILDTTQPTVSKILGKLRVHFGDPLFVRVGLSMHPTPKAMELAEPLKGLLTTSAAMQSKSSSFDPRLSAREFKVLVTEVGMTQIVPQLMRHLEKEGKSLRLRAVPLDSRSFEARLEAGEADIAIGAFPGAPATLKRQRLYSDTYASVVRKDHPRLPRLPRAEVFLRERHVVVTSSTTGHGAHQLLEKVFSSKLAPECVQLRVPSFVACAFVASHTDGVGTLPTRLAEYLADDLGLVMFSTPLNLPRIEISQFWHERMHRDQAHRWFRSAIAMLFGTPRPRVVSKRKSQGPLQPTRIG